MRKINAFIDLLKETIECAEIERNHIDKGVPSDWNYGLLKNVVFPEINELLSYANKGEIYFKYGKKQRRLESTYFLLDSFKRLSETPLGEKILELQHFYDSIS